MNQLERPGPPAAQAFPADPHGRVRKRDTWHRAGVKVALRLRDESAGTGLPVRWTVSAGSGDSRSVAARYDLAFLRPQEQLPPLQCFERWLTSFRVGQRLGMIVNAG